MSSNAGFSYGSYRGTEFNGALNAAGENFGLALIASTLETDNYRVHNALNQRNLQGDLRYKFSNGSAMLKFGLDDQTLELPSNRTATQLINDRRGVQHREISVHEKGLMSLSEGSIVIILQTLLLIYLFVKIIVRHFLMTIL